MTFDYRGYGQSTGTPDPKGLVLDGVSLIRWICQNKSEPIVVLAQSLGGAIAMASLANIRITASMPSY